jgi:uncharacterized membrane protein
LAYIHANNPNEYQAIHWLNDNISGTPVILEAAENTDYRYEYARISSNTGLVTVSGWQSHVEQREHWGLPQQRILDVKEIYTSPDIESVVQLLRQYHVEYIYVGETERRDFAEEELQKFQNHPEYFEVIFQSGNTFIYWVKQ